MGLVAGTRLGVYEITTLIGAGGMGEVYRARDTRLKREVAIKVLPDTFAGDAERLARFQREAELLATLNHPNIGAVYGLEQTGTATAIVLELIDGDTLAERLQRGAIPVETALHYAQQIAEALEAAHERGIVHRDLKPANIKITPDDRVKVLDFGLAKLSQPSDSGLHNPDLSHSPTLSMMATQAGMILGTAAYMSPEQAKGAPADHRSDVFAFGGVLYEMLTGRQPFKGDTAPDVLAAVIVREADLSALPANLNPRIAELLKRCLEKKPKKRWQAMGDVRAEIEVVAREPHGLGVAAASARPLWRRMVPVIATAIVTASIAAAVAYYAWPTGTAPVVTRLSVPLDEGQQFTAFGGRQVLSISRDGTQLVYAANGSFYLRSMTEFEARAVPGALTTAGQVQNPIFSPDGRSIAFWSSAETMLKKVAVTGGAPVALSSVETLYGMSWNEDGIIYSGGTGIMRVPASGGKPEVLVSVNRDEAAGAPQMLAGGQAVLFTLATGSAPDRWEKARIVVQLLRSGERRVLVEGASDARYLPTGHLVYAVGGVLSAVPFNLQRLEVTGSATPVLDGVRRSTGTTIHAHFGVSNSGTLVYIPGPSSGTVFQWNLAMLDRKGTVEPLKLPPGAYVAPRISPDGKQVAFGTDDGKETAIWIYEVSGRTSMRRLTFGGRNRFPVWSRDSQRVAFQSDREGDLGIFWQRADGTGAVERLTRPDPGASHVPESWSPTSDVFLFTSTRESSTSMWVFSVNDRKTVPFDGVQSTLPLTPVFSPDGKWVAYTSTETGGAQVFVQPFPATGSKYLISKSPGHHPLWSPDGRELIYDVTSGLSEVVSVATVPAVAFGNPQVLPRGTMQFAGQQAQRPVDMAPDGRILGRIDNEAGEPATPQIRVVLNWTEELKARVPVK